MRSGRLGGFLAVTTVMLLAACGGGKSGQEAAPADSARSAAAPAGQAGAEQAQPTPAGQSAASAPATSTSREGSAGRAPSTGAPATTSRPAPERRATRPSPSSPTPGAAAPATGQAGPGTPSGAPAATPRPTTVSLEVPSGTQLETTLDSRLSTQDSKVGDAFTVTVSRAVSVGQRTAIPSGARVDGKVTAVQKSGGSSQPAVLKLDFTSLTVGGKTYPISASVVKAEPQQKSRTSLGDAALKIGAGTAAGAILGRIIGGNQTGTFVGAAVGAAAGTAIMLGTRDVDAVLPANSPMTLQLERPVTVTRPR